MTPRACWVTISDRWVTPRDCWVTLAVPSLALAFGLHMRFGSTLNGVRGDAGAAREGRWPVYTNAVLELTFQLLDLRVQELLPDG